MPEFQIQQQHQITDDSLFVACCVVAFAASFDYVVIVVCQVCSTSYHTLLGEERYYYRNATFCNASGAFEVSNFSDLAKISYCIDQIRYKFM